MAEPTCRLDRFAKQGEHCMDAEWRGSLTTFGGFCLRAGDLCLKGDESRSRKVWSLISYLVLNRERDLEVEELYHALWQDKEEADISGALKTLIFRARRMMEEAGFPASAIMLRSRGIYRWNPDWKTETDAENFEALCTCCLKEDFDMEAGQEEWKKALSLYKGDFLEGTGEFAWIREKAAFYRNQYQKLVQKVCLWLLKNRRYKEAEDIADQGLELYEFCEGFEGCKILALYHMGQVEAALNRYLAATDKFYKECQITPSDKFKELYHIVRNSYFETPKDFEEILAELTAPETEGRKEEDRLGAYECEYAVFKRLFWLERRSVSRSGESVYLCLLSIERPKGGKMKTDVLYRAAEKLKNVIRDSLRASDIFARYSAGQYVVLIPGATYEKCETVMQRITQAFNRTYVRRDVGAVSHITAVLPTEQES